ncbi:hypothetical protein SAMN05446635_7322 [Burkholderia sp. OK233]|nr:hypothetical protein SAMN05446635_7322 [Burkholderia sp. OK233]
MQNLVSCRIRFNNAFTQSPWREGMGFPLAFAAESPNRFGLIQDPDMYPPLRFVTRAPSTAVFRPTLNRQR